MNAILDMLGIALIVMVLLFSCGLLTVGMWMIVKSCIESIRNKYDI